MQAHAIVEIQGTSRVQPLLASLPEAKRPFLRRDAPQHPVPHLSRQEQVAWHCCHQPNAITARAIRSYGSAMLKPRERRQRMLKNLVVRLPQGRGNKPNTAGIMVETRIDQRGRRPTPRASPSLAASAAERTSASPLSRLSTSETPIAQYTSIPAQISDTNS